MSKRKIRTPGVYHDSNGTYYLKYKNKTYRGFKSVEDAELHKAALRIKGDDRTSSKILDEVAADFLTHEKSRVDNNEIKYGTYQKKEQLYRVYIKDLLGKKRMDKLTLLSLRDYRTTIGNLDISSRQKNYILQITKQIILHGVRYFDIKVNNTIELTFFKKSRAEARSNLNDLRNVLSDDEFRCFISKVDNFQYHYLFLILYLTGMRLGEALALQWNDFNEIKTTLHIHKTLTNKTEKKGTELIDAKTVSSERDITIPSNLASELKLVRQYYSQFYGFNNEWFILGGSKPLSTATIDRKKKEAIDKSGVKYFTNHQLRHSFITNAFSRGEQLTSIGEYVGHKNIAETMRTYAHLSAESSSKFDIYLNKSSQNLLNTDLSIRKPTV